MNTIDPKSFKIVKGLPPKATKDDRVAVDVEIFGMVKGKFHRPIGTFASLQCTYDAKVVYIITDQKQVPEFIKRIDAGVHVFHNAKFDVFHLRRWAMYPQRKRLWDTMLIDQIMWSGYYDGFSLADVARRYLNIYLEKETREEFETATEMTQSQLAYAAVDVVTTWKVYQEQKKIIEDNDLDIWTDIELPFMWVLLGMSGVCLDKDAWMKLAEHNYQEAQKIAKRYSTINLNSPMQVKKYFKEILGITVDSTGVEVLETYAEKDCEFAKEMLLYRTCAKRSSTYGEKFITDYVEEDGKIYGDIYQMGACTGRTSSRNPNLQNQPHSKEYRDCFIADDDMCLVVGDWGAQEPRIAAYFTQDRGLIKALNGKEKLYIAIARDVLNKSIKKDSEEYKHMKSTILGIFYGMSAFGLSKRLGVTEEKAVQLITKLLKVYPGIQEYIIKQTGSIYPNNKTFPESGRVESIKGRKIWLNPYSSGWMRDALNYPIQSSAADAMKIAARRFLERWAGEDFYIATSLVLLVHDEIVVECLESQKEMCMKLLEKVMIDVAEEMHPGIRGVAEISSGKTWGCKA